MINYSIVMRANPVKKDEASKAYATAQYSDVMNLEEFAAHIAGHGCVYSRADIAAVLTLAVDCIYEQLLAGQKILLGDLGSFSVSLGCEGAESAEKFSPSANIKRVKVKWQSGSKFKKLGDEAEFNLVATRFIQAKVNAALKAGATSIDLTTGNITGGSSSGGNDDTGGSGGSGSSGDEGNNPL